MTPGRTAAALVAAAVLVAACAGADDEAGSGGGPEADAGVTGASTTTMSESAASADDGAGATAGSDTGVVAVGSPSIGPGGNRVARGVGAVDRVEPIDIELPDIPVLVLPVTSGWADPGGRPAPRWYVEFDSGEAVVIDETDAVVAGVIGRGAPEVDGFDDPLPDAVVIEVDGLAVALVQPTDRYPHGALGDRIEAAAVQVLGPGQDDRTLFGPEPPAVIEGISTIVADATGDGRPEILVTHSDADQGASLALWTPDGELVASSEGIGLGNRWRNQLAIAPVGPNGEVEIIDVRTPHIGGTVQYFRIEGDRLVRVASNSGFTSHRLGSRNLDLGVVADADGDGALDVVVPTDRRDALGVLTRTEDPEAGYDGVEVVAELPLPGRMTTNLGVRPALEGDDAGIPALGFAVGTDESVLRIWPAPDPGDR